MRHENTQCASKNCYKSVPDALSQQLWKQFLVGNFGHKYKLYGDLVLHEQRLLL